MTLIPSGHLRCILCDADRPPATYPSRVRRRGQESRTCPDPDMANDRDILVRALEPALRSWEEWTRGRGKPTVATTGPPPHLCPPRRGESARHEPRGAADI